MLFLGLAVSHIVGIGVYSLDRSEAVTTTEALDRAERVAGAVKLLRQVPAQWREEIVRGSDDRSFSVELGLEAEATAASRKDNLARQVDRYLDDRFPDWPPDRIHVNVTDRRTSPEAPPADARDSNQDNAVPTPWRRGEDDHVLNISFQLDDGEWLNVVTAIPQPSTLWLESTSAYILSIAIGIGAIAMWLVFRVTTPLTKFARAADRLGKNIRAEPLAEDGPTEVAQAARAFNAMQERLRRLVENRTQILAAVSHDLRTPVTMLRLRAELMDESDDRTKVLQTLDEMETMIASVLAFSRATFHDESPRRVSLPAMVGSICDDMTSAGATIRFESAGEVSCLCRRVELKRALTNLIDNAVRYGGTARVTIEQQPGTIHVVIDDDGPGIPECQQDAIFMPFYRLDSSRSQGAGGVGLGLSIARAIIDGHGGTIALQNRAEGGFRVRVSLPT